MLDKSSNFVKQSHSLYLVYECLTYLNKESRNSIFLYIFSAHQQNDLQIQKLYIREKNDSSEILVLFSFSSLIIFIINHGVVNACLNRAEDVRQVSEARIFCSFYRPSFAPFRVASFKHAKDWQSLITVKDVCLVYANVSFTIHCLY